jgi:PAS domain S-box-containing protein
MTARPSLPASSVKRLQDCGCQRVSSAKPMRVSTDVPVDATPDEMEALRAHLNTMETLLAALFGPVYSRSKESLRMRAKVAEVLVLHFDGIIRQWEEALSTVFQPPTISRSPSELTEDLSNELVRFIDHLRDPDDLRTYVYLKRHCQQGIFSRAAPSEFDTINIALKQVMLKHTGPRTGSRRAQAVRDIVVAAIDERRLMVSWFYIESREKALRASEEKYRNSIDHAPDPMYEIDPETLIVTGANSAAEKLHRMMPGEEDSPLVGRPIADFMPAQVRERAIEHLTTVLHKGAAQTFDLALGPFYVEMNLAVIPYGNERFIHMILHDVTHRREMMDELLKAERLAAAGTFAAGIAHEVNNPLASISSLVQSLLSSETDDSRRVTLHTILAQITRISSTLKDLVSFARPSEPQRNALNLNRLIAETLRLVSYNPRFKGTKLEPVLAPALKPVFADENEIQQVLLNLLFNAADATQHAGGIIRVVTENQREPEGKRSERVGMRVIDNGIGIPKEHLARVFDPFFTTKPAGAGVGLGLSLCQRIILGNGGTIAIESEVGEGTSVTITLPAFPAEHRAQSEALQ